jgi:hypothetical protein
MASPTAGLSFQRRIGAGSGSGSGSDLMGSPRDDLETGAILPDHMKDRSPFVDAEIRENGGKYAFKAAIFQVTIRCPTQDPLLLIAMAYGFLPFLPPIFCFCVYFRAGSLLGLYGVFLSLSLVAVNEGCLKGYFRDPRPIQSANRTASGELKFGMPSGHVLNAVVMLVWIFSEIISAGMAGTHTGTLSITVLLLAPVPWARYYNLDHSFEQVVLTTLGAIPVGVAAFCIRRLCLPNDGLGM